MNYKVFGIGMIRGVNYTKEKLKDIFNSESSSAIYGHTSEYSEGAEIVELGEFKDFEIKEDGVYSNLHLNEFGKKLKESGAIKGISIEINSITKKLSKIALLPIFQKQAIIGAEFKDKDFVLEFKQTKKRGENTMTEKEIRDEERARVKEEMKNEFKATVEEAIKAKDLEFAETLRTEVEKVKAEYEFKAKLEEAKSKAMKTLEEKLPEVARKGYEFALSKADKIEDEVFGAIEALEGAKNNLKDLDLSEGKTNENEFKDKKALANADYTMNFLRGVK